MIYIYGDTQTKSFPLIKEKNFVVDDIENFLTGYLLDTREIQYFHHSFQTFIKLVYAQSYQAPISFYQFAKYVKIENYNESPVYYYVESIEVLSKNCIKLNLIMDTLNSCFCDSPRKLSFDKKTKVIREHQNRFYAGHNTSNRYVRRIPLLSESIIAPFYKIEDTTLNTLEKAPYSARSWYLIYQTLVVGENSPIQCYLLNDIAIKVQNASTTTYKLSSSQIFNMLGTYNALVFTRLGNTGSIKIGTSTTSFSDEYPAIIFAKNSSNVVVGYKLSSNGTSLSWFKTNKNDNFEVEFIGAWSYGGLVNLNFTNEEYNAGLATYVYINVESTSEYELDYNINNNGQKVNINQYSDTSTIPFSSLDRTDSRLVKVIALPYCPIKYNVSNGVFTSSTPFTIENGMIKLDSQNLNFAVDLSGYDDTMGALEKSVITLNPQEKQLRNIIDSKCYHSDFYYKKYVYDSFSYIYKLENVLSIEQDYNSMMSDFNKTILKYYVSNAITSKMYFNVKDDALSCVEQSDFDYMFFVNRNNEMPLFDSSYINYLRTGFNYDVKSKNRNEAILWTGVALSSAGAIAGFATGNVALGASAVVGGIMSYINAINSTISAEQNLNQKLAEYERQKATVLNADDVDLLKKYSSNKVHLQTWSVSENIQKLTDNLFYYCGYITNEFKVPTHNNRIYFDYLLCEPVFENTFNWDSEIIDDVIAKCNSGITFIHNYNNEYDFAQKYENYEIDLM